MANVLGIGALFIHLFIVGVQSHAVGNHMMRSEVQRHTEATLIDTSSRLRPAIGGDLALAQTAQNIKHKHNSLSDESEGNNNFSQKRNEHEQNPLAMIAAWHQPQKVALKIQSSLPEFFRAALEAMPRETHALSIDDYCNGPIPSLSAHVGHLQLGTHSDYKERVEAGSCTKASGMWNPDASEVPSIIRYKVEIVAELFGLRPGMQVLDWGAGCGHSLDLIAGELGFDAVAFDLVAENVAWGRKHLQHIHNFCTLDGSSALPYGPGTFNAVLSNAALYHLTSATMQCASIKEVKRILRPGGCAWFGWLGHEDADYPVSPEYFTGEGGCFDKLGLIGVAFNEIKLFGETEHHMTQAYSLFFCSKT